MKQAETELVAVVRALARSKFTERAAEHDRAGTFPAENMAELRALGVPGMITAAGYGGGGMGAEALVRVMEEIAYADASTAVALNMHLLIAHFLTVIPVFPRRDVVLRDVAEKGAMICGPGSIPTGELDERKSGYVAREEGANLVINGEGGFASMADGATYVIIGARIDRGEGVDADVAITVPRMDTAGIENLHNWDAMGLRATASHDIRCMNAVVPRSEALVVSSALLRMAEKMQPVEMAQRRSWGVLGILGIWLGQAQAAFDFSVDYVSKRHGYLAGSVSAEPAGYRSDAAWAQMDLGSMEHWLETGRVVLYDTVRRLETPFESVQAFTRHLVRTVYHLRRMGEEVAAGSMRVCGAHAYVRGRPLERIVRDLIGGNVMVWKTSELQQSLGLAALGREIMLAGPAGT